MTDLLEFSYSLLKAFLTYSPVIVPSLVVFILSASASLRLYLAATNIPTLTLTKEKIDSLRSTQQPLNTKNVVVSFALLLVYYGILFGIIHLMGRETAVFDAFCAGFFLPIAIFSNAYFMSNTLGCPGWVLHRKPHGLFSMQPYKPEQAICGAILVHFTALGVSIDAFIAENAASIVISLMAISYALHAATNSSLKSFRHIVVRFLLFAGILALVFAAFFFLYYNPPPAETMKTKPEGAYSEYSNILPARAMIWGDRILSTWSTVTSTAFISMCLRFDYSNHIAKRTEEEIAAHVTFETVPTSKLGLSSGILIPANLPVKFPKPYYTTALVAWALANAALLSVLTFFHITMVTGYGVVNTLISVPIMCIAVFGVSALRGEGRKAWAYYEQWFGDTVNVKSSIKA